MMAIPHLLHCEAEAGRNLGETLFFNPTGVKDSIVRLRKLASQVVSRCFDHSARLCVLKKGRRGGLPARKPSLEVSVEAAGPAVTTAAGCQRVPDNGRQPAWE